MNNWSFVETINGERLMNLESGLTFEEIVQNIRQMMEIKCCVKESLRDAPVDGYRYFFSLKVDPKLVDLFFNSKFGIRGWYYQSAYEGIEKTNHMITELSQELIEYGSSQGESIAEIKESLKLRSAKAWIAESGNTLCDMCPGEWHSPSDDEPEIFNDRWENLDCNEFPLSRYGRKAPYGLTRIRVFGGWIDENGNEYVSPRKVKRASDINLYGWS